MKTCVLCFSRRNAFEWTIRSRSRWNGVRSGESSSGWARRAGYERAASCDSADSSAAAMRSWNSEAAAVVVVVAAIRTILPARAAGGGPGYPSARLPRRRHRCLRRPPADRHPDRRAAHVVESRYLEDLDRLRIAPVLAADPQLEIGLCLAAGPRGQPHEPPHAGAVDRLERASVHDPPLDVTLEEPALHIVAREAERGLGQVIGPEREEVGDARDPVRHEARARQLDHRPDGHL